MKELILEKTVGNKIVKLYDKMPNYGFILAIKNTKTHDFSCRRIYDEQEAMNAFNGENG